MANTARLLKDFGELIRQKLVSDDNTCFVQDPEAPLECNSNMREFTILLRGPPDTPYSGGMFRIKFEIVAEYPFKPPKVKFLAKIHHPNINGENICLDILSKQWAPSMTFEKILHSLSAL